MSGEKNQDHLEMLSTLAALVDLLEQADWCQECAVGKAPDVAKARALLDRLTQGEPHAAPVDPLYTAYKVDN